MNSDRNSASTLTSSLLPYFQDHILVSQISLPSLLREFYITFKRRRKGGGGWWLSQVNVLLFLILVQVMLSESWGWALRQATHWAGTCVRWYFSPSLPHHCPLTHPHALLKKRKKNVDVDIFWDLWLQNTASHSAMKESSKEDSLALFLPISELSDIYVCMSPSLRGINTQIH